MKKLVLIMLSLVLLATSLVACSKKTEEKLPNGAVPVLSNYPNLEYILPGEYDTSKFEDGTWARYSFATFVTEVDGELAIMSAHTCGSSDAPYISKSEVYIYPEAITVCFLATNCLYLRSVLGWFTHTT